MVEYAPSTGGLALWVRHHDRPVDRGTVTPTIATDGNAIVYGSAFESLPLPEQAGLVAHEVLHIALRHPQRFLDLTRLLGDVDLELFTICADSIVNSALSHLSWIRLPTSAVYLDQLLARTLHLEQRPEQALLEWDVERLYRAIDDRRAGSRDGARSSRRQRGGDAAMDRDDTRGRAAREGRDTSRAVSRRTDGPRSAAARALGDERHADLIPDAGADAAPHDDEALAREWSERILRAHAGDGSHSMLRALLADLPKTRTPWEQVLRTRLARSLSAKPGISWSRPARSYLANQGRIGSHRLPWEPGHGASTSVPRLVVIVDVSGSIEDALMDRFAREIEAITRRREAALVLIVGDDRVRRVARFEPGRSDLRQIGFTGGGGTDFTPLLEEAEMHRPDIAVVLTDLQGPVRFRPRWPVIWAVPAAYQAAVPPFGRLMVLH
jgi:predicted metal-dependent peptidase